MLNGTSWGEARAQVPLLLPDRFSRDLDVLAAGEAVSVANREGVIRHYPLIG